MIQTLLAEDPKLLYAMLEPGYEPPDAPPPQDPQPEPEPELGAQPGDDDEPPADPAAPPTDKKPRTRISLGGIEPATQTQLAVVAELLRTGQAVDLAHALEIIEGKPAQGRQAPAARTEPDQPAAAIVPPAHELQEIDQRIADLSEQRRQASADYRNDVVLELTEQIEDAKIEKMRAEQRAEIRASQQATFETQANAHVAETFEKYPDLADETSPLARLVNNKILAAEVAGDPALNQPDYFAKFADEIAGLIGVAKSAPTPTATNPATRPPLRQSRPVGASLAPGHGGSRPLTSAEAREAIDQLDPKALASLIFTH